MKRLMFLMLLLAVLGFTSTAKADTWAEVGDAGALPGTAQVPLGSNPLTQITGTLSGFVPLTTGSTDADMYRIHISTPAAFSASTVGPPTLGSVFDTQLFLLTATGMGVYANDDASVSTLRSTLPAGNALSPTSVGDYFLIITGFDLDPVSVGGQIFDESGGFTSIQGPDLSAGGGSPITGYTGIWFPLGDTPQSTYTINLTGAEFVRDEVAVPEPTSLMLLSLGFAGLAARRRFTK